MNPLIQPAPVVLFTYNRPWHTRQTLNALKKNNLSELTDLIIYSDGPKNITDCKKVQEVRNYLKTVNGFKRIKIIEREDNTGLADSVISGVTEVINEYSRIIVLEDDLVTAPHFLYYMNHALRMYEKEEKVMQISGHMFDIKIDIETDAVFLPFITSWGWATWKRAWDHFDPLMIGYTELKKDRRLQYKFNLEGSYNYFSMLEAQIQDKIDSWAIRWYLSVFLKSGIVLYPVKSYIENIGFDGSGTHYKNKLVLTKPTHSLAKKISDIHYPETNIDKGVLEKIQLHLSFKRTIRDKLKTIFSKIIRNLT